MAKITINVRANKRARTWTIRECCNGKCFLKYRTCRLSEDEMAAMEYFNELDWRNWLRTFVGYYKVV